MSIILDRLSKLFGSHSVVDQISLELANGEFFVLLGPSGSGKSTVLRLIAGLTQPDAGRILLHGQDVTSLPPQQRGTGFVFQNYSIFRHMSVAENVEFGLKIRKIAAEERVRKREHLLDLVGLAGLGDRYAGQLSGGQLQRVALARALAYEPKVLLLDEPFGALDSKIRTQLRRSFKEIQQRLKVTTILVTHDQEEAFELADRIGVMERGKLLETGIPEALYFTPKSLPVATFLGAGTVLVGRADGAWARFGSLSLPIPPEIPHEEGARAQVLFRPEHVVLSTEEPDPGMPVIGRGRILERTFSGPFQKIRLQLPHLTATRQVAPAVPFGEEGLLIDAMVPAEMHLPGDRLWVGVRAWHILDQPHPRLLIYAGQSEHRASGPFIQFARQLSDRLDAATTLLGIADRESSGESLTVLLQRHKLNYGFSRTELQIRYGDPSEQLVEVQEETPYDLLVLGADGQARMMLVKVLEQCTVPVLVVPGERAGLQRMLICTAAGEPGKSDVRTGGRLARLLKAAVTLLYVTAGEPPEISPVAGLHLERATATLRGLDIDASVRIRSANAPAEGILAEIQEGDYDLVVVGVHGPWLRSFFSLDDVTFQVLNGVDRPVLVVPIETE